MINMDINPLRIIREAREKKKIVSLALTEIFFVSSYDMNETEKWIWLILTVKASEDANFSCSLTYQELAVLVQKPIERVRNAVQRLQHMGFIIINIDAGQLFDYTLDFPLAGLLALKKAEKRAANKVERTANTEESILNLIQEKPKFPMNEVIIIGRAKENGIRGWIKRLVGKLSYLDV